MWLYGKSIKIQELSVEMKAFVKLLWNYLKKKCWYIILLGFSTTYVWCFYGEINDFKELNVKNIIFILWLILLLLPLFSEMEFLGVKIKKEVQKETEEVKGLMQQLQMQINQLQLTNSVANTITLGNSTLPSEQKIEELLQRVTELQNSNLNSMQEETKESFPKVEDNNVYLFKVRLDIEISLRELCEKAGFTELMTISKMMQVLKHAGVLQGVTIDLIYQVNKIVNRGVHGEIVSEEYIDFVRKMHPEIIRQLRETSKYMDDYIPRNVI